ncbi:MAG: class I SAM-dependent methyltransferase [Proteobacteria bacterium]|nr:class I SAM-dependent methyltransferase [Pseudomonadota bacterium]
MTKLSSNDFFTKDMAQAYDQRNSKLSPIFECMHFLSSLVLKELPGASRILCVGVGTGAEIFSLSKAFPKWSFVGVDPSASMLEVCRERLAQAGILDRCQLVYGYVSDVESGENFDAVLSILVGHFVSREDRIPFFQNMISRLKKGGYLINTEISFDLDSKEFPLMLKNWEQVQSLMGATPESLAALPKQLRELLTVLPSGEFENLYRQNGIQNPVRFFQALMISGWYGRK